MERNTRVIWASELFDLSVEGIDCYVEASKLFSLLPEIEEMKQGTCLKVRLKNGARYDLPFLVVKWDTPEMPEEYNNSITFKLDDLMLCTLKNLVKPELQCIYIDEKGAISCDFISACINNIVKCSEQILLPPDVQDLTNGKVCNLNITETTLFIKGENFNIVTARPTLSEEAKNDFTNLREMIEGELIFVKVKELQEGLKRLVLFGDFITFEENRVVCNNNFEPFNFKKIEDKKYEIESIKKVILVATDIGELEGNIVFTSETSTFLVSAVQEE